MNKKFSIKVFWALLFLLLVFKAKCQDTSIFFELNSQVWNKFEDAFRTNNAELLISLHSPGILRIPADSKTIISGKEYFDNQLESFKWVKENGYKTQMELRFTERISYENYASEKGVFKYTVIEPGGLQRLFYGEFYMVLEKLDNKNWKIILDYDSNKDGTINDESFNEASDKWDYSKFISNEN